MSDSVDNKFHETARKNTTTIIRGIDEVGLNKIAQCLNISTSTASKMKNPSQTEIKVTFERIALALAVMGLKVVDENVETYNPETIKSIIHLAKERMEEIHSPSQLLAKRGSDEL